MSATTKLTETPRQGLDPVNPKLVQQFEQLVDLLARRLSPAHARLLAEPVPVAMSGGRPGLAWFAAIDGDPHPVSELDAAAADALRSAAARLTSDIMALADELERQGEASRDLARLLRDALVVPDPAYLWSVDGEPVLVGWGYRRANGNGHAALRAGAITASTAAASTTSTAKSSPPTGPVPTKGEPGSPAPSVATEATRRIWVAPVLWLVFVLLCSVLADRLLQACAVGDAGWPSLLRTVLPDRCPAPSVAFDPSGAAVLAAIRAADGEVHAAELALTRRALSCDASCPVPTPRRAAVETPRAIPADVERRLEGIERGRGLEVTLAWEGASDLDIQIICPDRSRIAYNNRAACGGRLVTDQNHDGGLSTSRPVEHVIWDDAPAPEGRYAVEVSLFARHGETRPEIAFQVVLSRAGQVVTQRAGAATAERVGLGVLTFDMPANVAAGGSAVP